MSFSQQDPLPSYQALVRAAVSDPERVPYLVRKWITPLQEFDAHVLSTAFAEAAPHHPLAYLQIVIDAVALARNQEQAGLALSALEHVGSNSALFVQLKKVPEITQRLAGALATMAGTTRGYARIAGLLATLVDTFNAQMLAEDSDAPKAQSSLTRLGGTPGMLITSLHTECVRQCILARRRALHERVLQLVIKPQYSGVEVISGQDRRKAELEFHYYAGMVCASLGDEISLKEAERQWMLVFALPGRHVSAIQIATYKRLILLQIMLYGDKIQLPSFFATSHTRNIEARAVQYISFAEGCSGSGVRSMAPAISKIRDLQSVLTVDENLGFAEVAIQRLPIHYIRRVGNVYSSMNLGQLADTIGFSSHPLSDNTSPDSQAASLAQFIISMNDSAVVLEDTGAPYTAMSVVRFVSKHATVSTLPNTQTSTVAARVSVEQYWTERINKKLTETEALKNRLSELDRHLAYSEEYFSGAREQGLSNA
ncbi:hypothetical protein GGI07_005478 [Coemansia sp. Benny D115]|nr:hypothetical protein GGI07_005478 [Coemansia sp. Benny D115]